MFVTPDYTFAFTKPRFWRSIARLFGMRRHQRPMVFRTPRTRH